MDRRDFISGLMASSMVFLLKPRVGVSNHFFEKLMINSIDKNTKLIFDSIVKSAKKGKWHKFNIEQIIIKIARELLDSPYKSGTLEGNEEICRIDFQGLDCVTLMENCLDFARIIKMQKYSIENLIEEVTFTRYREGKLTDYTSRLHYTSDWIYDNIKKKVIEDKTYRIGGKPISFNVGFMSSNPEYYLSLKNNPQFIEIIKQIEKEINSRTYYYIPKSEVSSIEKDLNSGDIIAFVTSKTGLDYSHVGLSLKQKGKARLLHASSKMKKVIVDLPISEYIKNISTNIGITVLSPLNPI
jgi:hypothetical protein